jgi:hypothetical protein
MRHVLFLCTMAFIALTVGLSLLAIAPDEAIGEFDPYRPATLLPIMAAGVREAVSFVRDVFDPAFADLRDALQRTDLWRTLPQ